MGRGFGGVKPIFRVDLRINLPEEEDFCIVSLWSTDENEKMAHLPDYESEKMAHLFAPPPVY